MSTSVGVMDQTADPAVLFDAWMVEFRALIAEDAGLTWPPTSTDLSEVPPVLMTLATVGPDGYPRTRNVMVSRTDAGQIFFHTDSHSEKVRHLESNPKVSLTVLAADRSKQVTVVGDAVRSTPGEEAEAFAARSRYLQLLAWLSDRDLAEKPAEERHREWAQFSAENPDLASCPPETWAGFAVVPREYLFWTADSDGPSQRVHYVCAENSVNGWTTEVLPG
ncbi:pyridoxamine 5'-phosphate oxidase family protein [Corynebacterium sp.]|jgi:pyridoxamine 5'-phosphate oxidase|uniref:pyridoxamine 5'-phosphate oxidase family protein n=1 Tax=Corynebacterium sp. TaxID=1720 RepID=UPI0025BF9F1E|nr:pyridoxamine 5'-phosphate oxidase family protein [Corynebacterium sp.]